MASNQPDLGLPNMPGAWHDLIMEFEGEKIDVRWRRNGQKGTGAAPGFDIDMRKLTYAEKKARDTFRELHGEKADRSNKRYFAVVSAVKTAANLQGT